MKIVIYISILLSLASCKVLKERSSNTVHTHSEYRSDSLIIRETMTLDTLRIPAQGFSDSINLELLKQMGKMKFQNGRASTVLTYNDGQLYVDTQCDSIFQAYIKNQISAIKQSINQIKNKKIETDIQIKEVTKSPWYVIPLIVLVVILIIAIIYLVWKKVF